MNSQTKSRQPAIPRVVTTREPRGEGGKGWGEGEGREGQRGQARGKGEEETTGLSPNVFKFLGPVDRRKIKAY